MPNKSPRILLTLIIAGEMIFILPFVLARVFRPTLLQVFDINNFELGSAFSIYGIIALLSYFFGGVIADRYPLHHLIAIALIATGIGGLFLAKIPALTGLIYLYGYWGLTTILLFWAAMIKATRIWGGPNDQGKAFGYLEGGRGTVAALIGTIGVAIFSSVLPVDQLDDPELLRAAFQRVLWSASIGVIVVGVLSWFSLRTLRDDNIKQTQLTIAGIKEVFVRPTVWLQGVIIVCAYVGYKATDNFSLYASDVLFYNDIDAAKIGTLALWMRPVSAIAAGILADRFGGLKMTMISFLLVILSSLCFATGLITDQVIGLFFVVFLTACLGIYSIRGLYFAITQEGNIPIAYMGTAVGIMSILGFTPDIFMGPVIGYLLDRSPGILGHQHMFMLLASFSIVGLWATIKFRKVTQPS